MGTPAQALGMRDERRPATAVPRQDNPVQEADGPGTPLLSSSFQRRVERKTARTHRRRGHEDESGGSTDSGLQTTPTPEHSKSPWVTRTLAGAVPRVHLHRGLAGGLGGDRAPRMEEETHVQRQQPFRRPSTAPVAGSGSTTPSQPMSVHLAAGLVWSPRGQGPLPLSPSPWECTAVHWTGRQGRSGLWRQEN